jgi:ATP-dependent RNA helicase RhlE
LSFESFNLHPRILVNIQALNYTQPTPIQGQAIPAVISGRDVMGLAQTGTGKTAAFVIPILQKLLHDKGTGIRALIIAPTRELAQQIHDAISELCKGTHLKSMTLYGGVNINPQIKQLKEGVDIVVACPGRLLDHIQQRTISLNHVTTLVLDEADQMFDMGFFLSIRKILKYLPKQKQTLLFSATMPAAINQLAQEVLHNPVKVEIGHSAPAASVKQTLFPVPQQLKTELLVKILQQTETESVLIFTRTKHKAKQVAIKLHLAGFHATSLQGNLSQNKRQSAMSDFRDGKLQILVATDIASRGIDVTHISHVINYDMPSTVEVYTHRIGRTGRADKVGEAYTLTTSEDKVLVSKIERVLGYKLTEQKFEDFDYKAKVAAPVRAPAFKQKLKQALKKPARDNQRRR